MPTTYNQVSASGGAGLIIVPIATVGGPSTTTASVTVGSAGVGLHIFVLFQTSAGDPGTPSAVGACTVRINITTANANATWSYLNWNTNCGAGDDAVTDTAGLAIGLGTTGVKTASVEESDASMSLSCGTASASIRLYMQGTSIATMTGRFNFLADSTITLPVSSGAAPAAEVYNLASTKAGK